MNVHSRSFTHKSGGVVCREFPITASLKRLNGDALRHSAQLIQSLTSLTNTSSTDSSTSTSYGFSQHPNPA